jgi:hypothetical protein
MDYSLALRFFVFMLTLICIALVPFIARRDPAPVAHIVRIDALPCAQWPGRVTRAGVVCLLASFVLLLALCEFLLAS